MRPTPLVLARHRELIHPEISSAIIGSFFSVYNELGCGLLEAPYARALEIVLHERGFLVEREYPLQIFFRGQAIGFQRCDMFVDRKVIVEIKATETLSPIAERQLRNYLTAAGLDLGLLLHFGPQPRFHAVTRWRRPPPRESQQESVSDQQQAPENR